LGLLVSHCALIPLLKELASKRVVIFVGVMWRHFVFVAILRVVQGKGWVLELIYAAGWVDVIPGSEGRGRRW